MDIADNTLNTTLQLIANNNATFKCTNDPFKDYYTLTKDLNLLSTAGKVLVLLRLRGCFNVSNFNLKLKELILNQNNDPLFTGMDCMKIDKIYQSSLQVKRELDFDTSKILKNKLKCFEESILNPLNTYI
jgi:hypothetical protein